MCTELNSTILTIYSGQDVLPNRFALTRTPDMTSSYYFYLCVFVCSLLLDALFFISPAVSGIDLEAIVPAYWYILPAHY